MLRKHGLRLLIFCLGGWFLLDGVAHLGAEAFWFQEVGYLSVFLRRLTTQGALWTGVTALAIGYLLTNLRLAQRHKYSEPIEDGVKPIYSTIPFRLKTLLPITSGLSLFIGLMLAHYSRIAFSYWQAEPTRISTSTFDTIALWQAHPLNAQWYLGIAFAALIALLVYPLFLLAAIAIVLSILFGFIASQQWGTVLQYVHSTPFNATDPLFNRDISFYIFALPIGELIAFLSIGLSLYGFVSVLLTYLLSGNSLSQGWFPGFSIQQQRHLYRVSAGLMGAIALSNGLSCYQLLYSTNGVIYGAGYTDVRAKLPAYIVLSSCALAIAFYLLWHSVFWQPKLKHRRWVVMALWLFSGLSVVGVVLPEAVQYLIVQPNELVRERPYIQRTIASTRQAFGLEVIDSQTFNPQGQLTKADLQANELTIRNIRLWDQRPLLDTNRQLQQIRLYYRFSDANIDRYVLQTEGATRKLNASNLPSTQPEAERRQVLIAAREMDANAVPQQAQTWINRHLIYTHGYGFTVSPVNTVGAGGLPEYFVKDIGDTNSGALVTSSDAIRSEIPIGRPRIYYGEITDDYVMTGTHQRELDYPSGSDNVYNVYDGQGGISIGSWWRRGLFSLYLKDWRVFLTQEFQPQTKVLFRRNINQRIRAIAPFLRYDSDPYLVAVDANSGNNKGQFPANQNYLYWIVDAYTTSNHYPYSEPTNSDINYIRNSVKVVIDAYDGTTNFYVADASDPIIKTWSAIFPNLLKPLTSMPETLRAHIRYPTDFFKIQSERLMTYHMTDPQVFYNREDQWQIPNEVYGSEPRPVEPYYLITSLPTVPSEEFILLLPYTPRERTNLIAWLAARSDGENYGRLLLYTFPKERLIYGTEQIEARINQDPVISQQISLWNRQGSRAIQGNLLIVPIEQSLLYVEPIYLEATQNSLPTLVRVVVAYENRIVMAQTLEQALQAIFQPEVTSPPAIIRPVEEPTPKQ